MAEGSVCMIRRKTSVSLLVSGSGTRFVAVELKAMTRASAEMEGSQELPLLKAPFQARETRVGLPATLSRM